MFRVLWVTHFVSVKNWLYTLAVRWNTTAFGCVSSFVRHSPEPAQTWSDPVGYCLAHKGAGMWRGPGLDTTKDESAGTWHHHLCYRWQHTYQEETKKKRGVTSVTEDKSRDGFHCRPLKKKIYLQLAIWLSFKSYLNWLFVTSLFGSA